MENFQLYEFLNKTASESFEFGSALSMASDNISFLQFLEAKRTFALENIAESLNRLTSYNTAGNSISEELRIMNSGMSCILNEITSLRSSVDQASTEIQRHA